MKENTELFSGVSALFPRCDQTKSITELQKAGRKQRIGNTASGRQHKAGIASSRRPDFEAGEANYRKDHRAVVFICVVCRQPASLPLAMFMKMQVPETRPDSLNQNC